MNHTISLTPRGYVEIILIGPIFREHVTMIGEHLVILFTRLEDMGKDLRLLIDSHQATELKQDAHSLAIVILKNTSFTKATIIEQRERIIEMQINVLKKEQLADKVRIVNNHEDAVLWLEE